ncbi:hypothetical protein [Bacteroides thetaiotaomicron]|jgi:hypothetical protein|uniref:hypothetical protein n=2 Tax=Bacteroides thetaiotaomicron TaxID=818 RepID=UPI0015F6485B|nr:hypothetical protein [Bacteroides thetaiotaomicron]
MRMAYHSTNAEISAIKWIAREDMVKGGVYMLEYKKFISLLLSIKIALISFRGDILMIYFIKVETPTAPT